MDETLCIMGTLIIVKLNILSYQKYILHCGISTSTKVKDLSTCVRLCGVSAHYLHETTEQEPAQFCSHYTDVIRVMSLLHLVVSSIFLITCHRKNDFFFLTLSLSSSPCLGWCLHPSHILLRLFQYRKWFSVSDRDTVLRRCNPSPVLPFVPWGYVEYEPKDAQPHSHTETHKKIPSLLIYVLITSFDPSPQLQSETLY